MKESHSLVYVLVIRDQTQPEIKTGQFALLTSLHPVSVNDSQAASPPLLPRVGFTMGLRGSPLTPGTVFSKSLPFFPNPLQLSSHRLHQEQWLILLCQCSITGPVAWQCTGPQISTTCTALKSKESALAV